MISLSVMEVSLSNQLEELKLDVKQKTRKSSSMGILERSKPEHVKRCIVLLDHAVTCCDMAACTEGEGCRRTKQVLNHRQQCPKTRQGEPCTICQQVQALCELHAQKCQSECHVPLCHNNKGSEEYKLVVRKLMEALRQSSHDDKKSSIQLLIAAYPQTATKILRRFQQMKKAKEGDLVARPGKQICRKKPYIVAPSSPTESSDILKEFSWIARTFVRPV